MDSLWWLVPIIVFITVAVLAYYLRKETVPIEEHMPPRVAMVEGRKNEIHWIGKNDE